MKKYYILTLILLASLNLGADINGGDLKLHDLQLKSNDIQVPTSAGIAGCGAPPAEYLVWLDGSDPLATGEAPSAGAISNWKDKGSVARDFSQSTAGKKPVYNTSGYLEFDGTNDVLASVSDANWGFLFGDSSHFCSHLIDRDPTGGATQTIFATYLTGTVGRANYTHAIAVSGTKDWFFINNGLGTHVNRQESITEPANFYQYDTEYDRDGLRSRIAIDSSYTAYFAATGMASVPPTSSYYYYQIGAYVDQISASPGSSGGHFKGKIAQILCYTDMSKKSEVDVWLTCKKSEL